jgi:hypothetical protein
MSVTSANTVYSASNYPILNDFHVAALERNGKKAKAALLNAAALDCFLENKGMMRAIQRANNPNVSTGIHFLGLSVAEQTVVAIVLVQAESKGKIHQLPLYIQI